MSDIDAIRQRQRQQQTWATGDFSMVGTGQLIVGEMLCEAVEVHAGQTVLDIATGSGNTALAAARRGCRVTGIDFVPAQLERGRERAAAERLKITFAEGEAEKIPFPDSSFNVVLSTFGAMFAADPRLAADELLRVCRPGGKIGMANWTPEGMVGEMFQIVRAAAPPPPVNLAPPGDWGVEEKVRERFGDRVSSLTVARRMCVFRHFSPQHWVEFMKTWFGPMIVTFRALSAERQAALTEALTGLATRYNQSGDETLLARGEYAEVVAIKR
jgi:ubiquinone/menaquinone biosynthesis C-methylase UbiE